MIYLKSTSNAKSKDVEKFLEINNIFFEKEVSFIKSPLTGYNLRYDFYLKDYNLIIEYDGIQHFESVDFYGGEDEFKMRQMIDYFKNEHCFKEKINLVRIPYNFSCYQMSDIITKALNEKNHFIWIISADNHKIMNFKNEPVSIKIDTHIKEYFDVLVKDGLLKNNEIPIQSLFKGYNKFCKIIHNKKVFISLDYFIITFSELLKEYVFCPEIKRCSIQLMHYDLVSSGEHLSQTFKKNNDLEKLNEFFILFKEFKNNKNIYLYYVEWCKNLNINNMSEFDFNELKHKF